MAPEPKPLCGRPSWQTAAGTLHALIGPCYDLPHGLACALQAARLRAQLAGAGAEAYFEARHVVDVLLDFPGAAPPAEKVRPGAAPRGNMILFNT